MIYLQGFSLPSREQEEEYFGNRPDFYVSVYPTRYPFHVFRYRELPDFEFEPITIFCGGNGCGKSTVLNVIASSLELKRGAAYNRSPFFEDYVQLCRPTLCPGRRVPEGSRLICSDDVFDCLLDIRSINGGIDREREELFGKYFRYRTERYPLSSLEDYDNWREHADAKGKSSSNAFVRNRLMQNVQERSNGESALLYFTEEIRENALYLLDEPENSLSAELQLELRDFLAASVRAYRCQFIVSTHSPFLLSLPGAKIYDLDSTPPEVRRWSELKNVRIFYDFFRQHRREFEE